MTINWVLSESSRMRYAAGSSMYFAQGIPYGLMNIAVPAWLASQGVGAGQIASFLAVIILPWAFKLLSFLEILISWETPGRSLHRTAVHRAHKSRHSKPPVTCKNNAPSSLNKVQPA